MYKLSLNTKLTHLKPLLKEIRESGTKIVRDRPSQVKGKNVPNALYDVGLSGDFPGQAINSMAKVRGVRNKQIYMPKETNPIKKLFNKFTRSEKAIKGSLAHEYGHIQGVSRAVGKRVKDSPQTAKLTRSKSGPKGQLAAEQQATDLAKKTLDKHNLSDNKVTKFLDNAIKKYKKNA